MTLRVMVGHFPQEFSGSATSSTELVTRTFPGIELAHWPRFGRYWPPPGGSLRPDGALIRPALDRLGWDQADLYLQWGAEYRPLPAEVMDPGLVRGVGFQIGDWNVAGRLLHWLRKAPNLPVIADSAGAGPLRQLGLHNVRTHLPWGWQPTSWPVVATDPTDPDSGRDIDVLFVGSRNEAIHRQRERLLVEMNEPGIHTVLTTWLDPRAYRSLALRSKIMLNYSVRGEVNLRTFEAIASGCALMSEEGNTAMESVLRPGVDYRPYRPHTLGTQLRELLGAPATRAAMVGAGQARLSEFSFENLLADTLREHGPWLISSAQAHQGELAELETSRQWLLSEDAGCALPELYPRPLERAQALLLSAAPEPLPNVLIGALKLLGERGQAQRARLPEMLAGAELAHRAGLRTQTCDRVRALLAQASTLCDTEILLNGPNLMPPDFSWWRMELESALLEASAGRVRAWVLSRGAWLLHQHEPASSILLSSGLSPEGLAEVPELLLAAAEELAPAADAAAGPGLCAPTYRALLLRIHALSPRNDAVLIRILSEAGRHSPAPTATCSCVELNPEGVQARHARAQRGLGPLAELERR